MKRYFKHFGQFFRSFIPIILFALYSGAIVVSCSRQETGQRADQFDSLSVAVKKQLKSNADSALELSAMLYDMAAQTTDKNRRFHANYLRGKAFKLAGRNDSAYVYYLKMQQVASAMQDTSHLVESCNLLGTIAMEMKQDDSVMYWYNLGLLFAEKIRDTGMIAALKANIGLFFFSRGRATVRSGIIIILSAFIRI